MLLLTFFFSWKLDPILEKDFNGTYVICGVSLETELISWVKCWNTTWQGVYSQTAKAIYLCVYFTNNFDGLLQKL